MSRLINISEASSMAIHAIVVITGSEHPVNAGIMAEATGASRNHLAKVMQRLVKSGFVKSTRGPSGGFILNCDPDSTSLLDIYEAIEGPIEDPECPLDRPVCPFEKCLMGGIISKLSNEFKDHLKKQKISSIV